MEPEFQHRLSTLQSQIEHLLQKTEAGVSPIEQRLASMADQYAEYLQRWAVTVERHAQAVAQLEAYAGQWRVSTRQMRENAADRLQELVTTIEREWDALKRMQEEPLRELREQATSLTQLSSAMATASQQDVERTDSRFGAFERDVHLRLNELTAALQSALTEIRTRLDRQPGPQDAPQWSLDDVTRLHGQLRDGGRGGRELPSAADHSPAGGTRQLPTAAADPGDAGTSFPGAVTGGGASAAQGAGIRWAPAAVFVLAVAATLAGVLDWRLQRRLAATEERQRISDVKNRAALEDSARQLEAARLAAAKELAAAREMANRSQRIADVLSAPDLIRFNLSGAGGAAGQALFSRSRGIAINGSYLPSLPANATHQAWLLTRTTPVKMGALTADPDGTVTLVQDMPVVPRPVVGVMITEEPVNGGDTPSGATVLTSVRPARPADGTERP